VGGQAVDVGDPGRFQAGESGRAEAQLGEVHGRPGSGDVVADVLDLPYGCAAGEDVAV
jgi:hypothetical protein